MESEAPQAPEATDALVETPSAATRRELRKQDRRQAFVDAAHASFLEHGYAGTSMSGLIKEVGGSKATLWSYFRSKEELFAAVIKDVAASFVAELEGLLPAEGADPRPALVNFCRRFLEKIATPHATATWCMVVAESGRSPEIGRIFYENAASRTQAALQTFIRRHIELGNLADENPVRMAETLMNLCIAQHTRTLWGLGPPTPECIAGDAERYTTWFLRAYAPH